MLIAVRSAKGSNNGTGGTSLTLDMPSGVAVGDVLVMGITTRGGTGTTIAPPTGEPTNWVQRTTSFGSLDMIGWIGHGLTYGNGTFVAVGSEDTSTHAQVATSTDGTSWSQVSVPALTYGLESVAYGNSLWVAVGTEGNCMTATDPTGTWTQQTVTTPTHQWYSVNYGNSVFCACGPAYIVTSANGSSWNYVGSNPFITGDGLYDIAYGGGTWVVAGQSSVQPTKGIATATDPTGTWTQRTSSFGSSLIYGVAYGNSTWVAVGASGKIATATDPTGTWTQRTSPFGTSIVRSVAYGADGVWTAVADAGKIATAVDPTGSWTLQTSSFNSNDLVKGIATNGTGLWVASSSGDTETYAPKIASANAGKWTTLGTEVTSTTVLKQRILWKTASSSEPASYVFTLSPSALASGVIVALSDAVEVAPGSAEYSGQANASSSTVTSPTLGSWTSDDGIDVGIFGTAYGTSFSPPTDYTEPADGESASTGTTLATTTEASYRALTGVTTVGSIAATAAIAAVNAGHHIFIHGKTSTIPVPIAVHFIGSGL